MQLTSLGANNTSYLLKVKATIRELGALAQINNHPASQDKLLINNDKSVL